VDLIPQAEAEIAITIPVHENDAITMTVPEHENFIPQAEVQADEVQADEVVMQQIMPGNFFVDNNNIQDNSISLLNVGGIYITNSGT
jgi:hypothetical protein